MSCQMMRLFRGAAKSPTANCIISCSRKTPGPGTQAIIIIIIIIVLIIAIFRGWLGDERRNSCIPSSPSRPIQFDVCLLTGMSCKILADTLNILSVLHPSIHSSILQRLWQFASIEANNGCSWRVEWEQQRLQLHPPKHGRTEKQHCQIIIGIFWS